MTRDRKRVPMGAIADWLTDPEEGTRRELRIEPHLVDDERTGRTKARLVEVVIDMFNRAYDDSGETIFSADAPTARVAIFRLNKAVREGKRA